MRIITTKAKEHRFSKETFILQIEAYDHEDILKDDLFKDRKRNFDHILRRRLNHINTTETQRAKTKIITGMVKHIFRYMMVALTRELLAGEDIEVPRIGFIRMITFKFNNKYHGHSVERQRQKLSNRNDMPVLHDCRGAKIPKKVSYYISLHGLTAKKHKALVDNGFKYLDK